MDTTITNQPRLANAHAERRPRRRRYWRIWFGLLIGLGVLAGLGATYQAVATRLDRQTYPPPGQLIDIGGGGGGGGALRLHLHCLGAGSPTVILESGQGGLSSHWSWIQPAVARTTRVCAYDRAGVGWSDPGPAPRDARQITDELHRLLARADVPGPYVLVGHSYGGLYVRAYAATYPTAVAGVVLVDASHPDQWARLPGGEQQFNRFQWIYRLARVASRLGVMRLIGYNRPHPALPPQAAAQFRAMADTVQFVDTAADEFAATPATFDQVRAAGALGDLPLYVLSAVDHGMPPEIEQLGAELQLELAALSSNSRHQLVPDSNHASLVIEQEDAKATGAAILDVVQAVRTGQRLAAK